MPDDTHTTPPPSPIKQRALSSIIRDILRRDIATGVYRASEPISLRDLAKRFNVSTMPVREALRQLEAEGLIQFDNNRKISVRALSRTDVQELFAVREELEPLALRTAVPRLAADPQGLQDLADLIQQMDTATEAEEWRTLNETFHMKLYTAAQMPRLYDIITSLWIASQPYLRRYDRTPEQIGRAQQAHRELFDHVAHKRAAQAAKVLRGHIRQAGRTVTDNLFAAGE